MSGVDTSKNPQEGIDDAADLLMSVELLRQLGRSELRDEDLIHALNVDELHSCRVRFAFMCLIITTLCMGSLFTAHVS